MNQAAVIDTLRTVRDLEAAGIERAHAEAIVDTIHQTVIAGRGEPATKADLAALKAELFRTIWIQGGVIVAAAIGAMIALAQAT